MRHDDSFITQMWLPFLLVLFLVLMCVDALAKTYR